MSTATVQPPLRASWRARVWTWVVSIVLTVSALGCAFGGVLETCHALGGAYASGQAIPPVQLWGSGFAYDPQPVMPFFALGWLIALGLHAYASRRRRMSLLHILVPAGVFLLGALLAFRGADVCTSL
ncbi:MAG: hypothetical protein J7515_14920 [Caulobacter sp.]|nr:hypothetical protein [Caulobacter sp.]